MRYGMVWPRPPKVVVRPQTAPRIHGVPRPLSLPSSDNASAKPMLMPALNEAQYKQPSCTVALLAYCTGCGLRVGDFVGSRFVPLLFLGEIIEELANAGITCPLRGGFVKAARFDFHQGRFSARVLRPEGSGEPRRAAHDKALHILPPDERNMFAESLA